jgi:uncharacterized protein (DUF2249 family)/iron-sulfur cluster repair protein YtfE (RIC family)
MVFEAAVTPRVRADAIDADRVPGHGQVGDEHTLADEHAVLLHEMRNRARAVRAALGAGHWPAREIDALVDYLRYELLDQAATEERLLFPMTPGGFSDPRIHGLVQEHVQLREVADQLAGDAALDPEHADPAALAVHLDVLEEFSDRHMRREEAVLSTTTDTGVEPLRRPFRCHGWFPLTEGTLLDLDVLPQEFSHRAALERFSRLRPGEHLQVRSRARLDSLWRVLTGRLPGEFGWVYLEEGPDQWQADVTRRAPE